MRQSVFQCIQVTVHAGSSKRGVEIRNQEFHIYTTKKPIKGEANRDAIELLAEYFRVPKRYITLIKGEKTKNKIFRVESIEINKQGEGA